MAQLTQILRQKIISLLQDPIPTVELLVKIFTLIALFSFIIFIGLISLFVLIGSLYPLIYKMVMSLIT